MDQTSCTEFDGKISEGNQARQILVCCIGIGCYAKLETTRNPRAKRNIKIYNIALIFTHFCAHVRQL